MRVNKILEFNGNTNPKIEENERIENSYFRNEYIKAINIINKIISYNTKLNKKDRFDDTYNNIVVFNGDRGTGKTSCMLTVSNIIENSDDSRWNTISFIKDNEIVQNSKLIEINELIDPSILNDESIIEIIIAQLLKKFKAKIERNEIEEIDRKKILVNFERVFSDLKVINNSKNEIYDTNSDNIEALLSLTSSVELKKNIKNLVEEYLKIVCDNKKFLLLQIDDLDLNLGKSNTILEQIRRYLQIPNVLIMISVKMDQYKQIIDDKNLRKYRTIPKFDIGKMSTDYLEKLFPSVNIITMPDILSDVSKSETKCIVSNTEYNIEEYILDTIYEKTGFVFTKPTFGVAHIIPNSLREINIFVEYLRSLSNQDKKENFIELSNYFIHVKYKKMLKANDYKFLVNLYNNRLTRCNHDVIIFLIKLLFKKKKDDYQINNEDSNKLILANKIEEIIKGISDENDLKSKRNNMKFVLEEITQNYSEANICIGKVLRMFKICDIYLTDRYDLELVESIKLIYSFVLYKEWFEKDRLFEEIDSSSIRLQSLIGRDLYYNYKEIFDLKNQLYKLQTPITLNDTFKTFINKEILDRIDLLNEEKIDIFYLVLNLILPYSTDNDDKKYNKFILREENLIDYNITSNQKNFYFDGSLIITNLFYSNYIFKYMNKFLNSTKNKELVKTLEIRKDQINKSIKIFIDSIPFYNIEFLLSVLDYITREGTKTRITSNRIDMFTKQFLKLFNDGVNKVLQKTPENALKLELDINSILEKEIDKNGGILKILLGKVDEVEKKSNTKPKRVKGGE